MKLLHRYVIKEFLESFLFGLVVFSSILLLDQVFQLIDLLLSKGVALWTVLKLFLLVLPNIFSLTIPMAGLFGILLAYGRLSEDNEVTAFRSAGLPYKNFTVPVLVLMAALSLFLIYFNQSLSPSTHRYFRQMYQEVLSQSPLVKFQEKAVTPIGEYRLYIEEITSNAGTLKGINIYKFSPDNSGGAWRISASSAVVAVSPRSVVFDLYQGHWQKADPQRPFNLINMQFGHYRFVIPLASNIMPFSQSLREMTGAQLLNEIKNYRAKKMFTNFIENEYWLRWTLALAPLIFAIVGIPLGIVTERGGKSIGFGLSLVVIFVYYLLLITSLNIGEKGFVPPALILWLPNAVTLAAGILLWRRMLRR